MKLSCIEIPGDIPPRQAARLRAWNIRPRARYKVATALGAALLLSALGLAQWNIASSGKAALDAEAVIGVGLLVIASFVVCWTWFLSLIQTEDLASAWTFLYRLCMPWRPAPVEWIRALTEVSSNEPWLPRLIASRVSSLDQVCLADARRLLRRVDAALAARRAVLARTEACASLDLAVRAHRAQAAIASATPPAPPRRRRA